MLTKTIRNVPFRRSCLPIRKDGMICLVTKVKQPGYSISKGGWEEDETDAEGALREAQEEAGVRRNLFLVDDLVPLKSLY